MLTYTEMLEWEILGRINEARRNPQGALRAAGVNNEQVLRNYPSGRPPLRMNRALRGAAQGWAQLMASGQVDREHHQHYTVDGRQHDIDVARDAFARQFGEPPEHEWTIIHSHWPPRNNMALRGFEG